MFNVSKEIYNSVKQGSLKPEELVLRKVPTANGRIWAIQRLNDSCESIVLKGPELSDLMRKAANSQSLPENYVELGKNQRFRVFSKIVPGLETESHRNAVRSSLSYKIRHVKSILRLVGWGIAELKQKNAPFRSIDGNYVLAELTHSKRFTANDFVKMQDIWKESHSPKSFRSWLQETQTSWEASRSALQFIPWLTKSHFERLETAAWQKSQTKEDLSEWRKKQAHPSPCITEPVWYLHMKWENEKKTSINPISYDKWVDRLIEGRKSFWIEQPMESKGLINFKEFNDPTIQKLEKLMFSYELSGSSLNHDIWIARELWKETNPPSHSDGAFLMHLEKLKHRYNLQKPFIKQLEKTKHQISLAENTYAATPTNASGRVRRAYLSNQIYSLRVEANRLEKQISKFFDQELVEPPTNNLRDEQLQRWTLSRTTLPYQEWCAQQIFDPLVPHPFVNLGPEQRKAYKTECANGVLVRNQNVFPTSKENTEHSGKGWVIFVIGPKDDLYCGSHLRSVFHHSSFLSDATVMAAGELKTDEKGKITHISSKSGHYKPTHKENKAMLKWFEDRGVDLSQVTFTCFLKGGKISKPMNAKHYLNAQKKR